MNKALFKPLYILSKSEKGFADLSSDLENVGQDLGVSVKCQREEIFEMMHRI